tara:strand:- start:1671 stop:1934 length:264 start_codon:yes stop_codon:yes gene_type:complete
MTNPVVKTRLQAMCALIVQNQVRETKNALKEEISVIVGHHRQKIAATAHLVILTGATLKMPQIFRPIIVVRKMTHPVVKMRLQAMCA